MKYTTEELRIRLPCKTSGIFQSFAKFYSSFGCCATISGHLTYPHFRRLGCLAFVNTPAKLRHKLQNRAVRSFCKVKTPPQPPTRPRPQATPQIAPKPTPRPPPKRLMKPSTRASANLARAVSNASRLQLTPLSRSQPDVKKPTPDTKLPRLIVSPLPQAQVMRPIRNSLKPPKSYK